jgi:uncharacterized membrane protein YdjX (TVP38/TMEM64 family)
MRSPEARALRVRLAGLALVLLALLALAAAWSWSPMKEWLDIDLIVGAVRQLGASFGLPVAILGMGLALALAVPLVFLTLVAIVAFGPWLGAACAIPGALLGAAISYGIGAGLGHEVVNRMAGARINALSQSLARRGVVAIVLVRFVPVAPFAIVNMVAGASHIRLPHLLLGTAIGILPSMVVMMLFVDTIIASLKQPSSFGLGLLALTVALLVLGGWGLRRWVRKQQTPLPPA